MTRGFPAIESLLPHSGPMRLLDRVLAHDPRETRCAADPARAALFRDAGGDVPSWVCLELMAQCAAVHGGLAARERRERPRPGLFLGARRMSLGTRRLEPGATLEVRAAHVRGESGLVAFDGAVVAADGAELARGRLSFFVARSPDERLDER